MSVERNPHCLMRLGSKLTEIKTRRDRLILIFHFLFDKNQQKSHKFSVCCEISDCKSSRKLCVVVTEEMNNVLILFELCHQSHMMFVSLSSDKSNFRLCCLCCSWTRPEPEPALLSQNSSFAVVFISFFLSPVGSMLVSSETMNKLYRRWWRHATEARNLCMFLIVQIQPTKFTSLNSDCLVHTCWLLVWRIITLGLTSGFVGSITTRIKFLNDNISSF